MSAQFQDQEQAIEWLDAPRDPDHPPAPILRRWLTYTGLLTRQLRQACEDSFRLQVLEQGDGAGVMVRERSLRRVILWCAEVPCVYAESHLPHETLERIPSLRRLGNDPLGEMLQSQPGVSRSGFGYACLREAELPAPLESMVQPPLWARRSSFTVGGSGLVVAEAFLPGIIGCEPAPAGD